MNESLKLLVRGDVIITIGKKVYDIKNIVQTTAVNIIRRWIGAGSPRKSLIRVKNVNTTLADAIVPVSQTTFIGNDGAVKFMAVFSETSFEGIFNGLELRAPSIGGQVQGSSEDIFSKISGIDHIEKTLDKQMIIEWNFTVELNLKIKS